MKSKCLVVASATCLGLLATLPALAGPHAERVQAELDSAAHVPNEILVQYRRGADRGMKADARGRVSAERLERIVPASRHAGGHGELELLRVPPGLGLARAIERLAADPVVEFAEPNWIYRHHAKPGSGGGGTVPDYFANGSLWGMYGDQSTPSNAFGSQAAEAWSGGTACTDVWIGIIDEGYMYSHEDLAASAGTNPGEIPGDGIDNDGNGYADDVYGWDFDGNNASLFDGTADDHGTHVAGTIAADGGNGRGVAGVCWSVKLLGAKFLGNQGGTTANAIKAVDYFTDLKTRHGINLVATNNSWGGGGFSTGLRDAIERANAANILFVAAAGNGGSDGVGDNNDLTPHYPSSYANANVIAVASITSSGARSGFSNYGLTSVDLGAPGSGIWSTVPKSSGKGRTATVVSGYASYSGTSMATPHVTGAAALYAARHPTASAAQIKAAILSAGAPTAALNGKTVTGDRLDVSGF